MFKRVLIILFSALVCSTLITFILAEKFNILSWVNTLFIVSLILLVCGCTLMIVQDGFFNGFVRSFKRFFHSISKTKQIIEDIEGKRHAKAPHFKIKPYYMKLIVISGVILVVLSTIISLFIA